MRPALSNLPLSPSMNPPSVHTSQPHHQLELHAQLGELHLHVDLALTCNWTVLFGPSGSGKSSILRAIAGLLPRAETKLLRSGSSPQDIAALPARARRIAYAPQQPSLFPHLTVLANILFSQQSNIKSTVYEKNINSLLQLFRLADLTHRHPKNLSGGERQRVNLARAFAVPDPQLMLLDEPFTGIDRELRDAILPELRSTLRDRGIPVLSVTHDVEEAFLLATEVIRLEAGRVHDQGPVTRVLAAERLSLLKALR